MNITKSQRFGFIFFDLMLPSQISFNVMIFTFLSDGMRFEKNTVVHVKFHNIAFSSCNVLSAEDSKAEGEQMEYGYPITCGDSQAVLLFKKFVCPGINVRCVKVSSFLLLLYVVCVCVFSFCVFTFKTSFFFCIPAV